MIKQVSRKILKNNLNDYKIVDIFLIVFIEKIYYKTSKD